MIFVNRVKSEGPVNWSHISSFFLNIDIFSNLKSNTKYMKLYLVDVPGQGAIAGAMDRHGR